MGAYFQELFRVGLYKRTQGKIARQVTAAVLWVIAALGAWRLSATWIDKSIAMQYGVPLLIFAFGAWIAYRLVNVPAFADFLISVEAEMNKVSWPGREELIRASFVVIGVMFFLDAILFDYVFIFSKLLKLIGIT